MKNNVYAGKCNPISPRRCFTCLQIKFLEFLKEAAVRLNRSKPLEQFLNSFLNWFLFRVCQVLDWPSKGLQQEKAVKRIDHYWGMFCISVNTSTMLHSTLFYSSISQCKYSLYNSIEQCSTMSQEKGCSEFWFILCRDIKICT